MSAFCSLEEAYGNDYKSFLSPASLEPNWLAQRKQAEIAKAKKWTQTPVGIEQGGLDYEPDILEGFDPTPKKSKNLFDPQEDADLLQDYDEFNLPLKIPGKHSKDPRPNAEEMDDYYKLIDSQYDIDTINAHRHRFQPGYTAGGDFETESPYSEDYSREIQRENFHGDTLNCKRLESLRHHITQCKDCQLKLRKLLNDVEGKSDTKDEGGMDKGTLAKLIDSTSINSTSEKISNPYKAYIELIFFIAVGVFLIFILDTFVKLGKVFSKA
jgi:hypothetical protein